MRVIAFSTLALAVAVTTALVRPARADKQDFTVVNSTGYTIDSVYVSPHSSESWGEDIMGSNALIDGNGVNITFDHPTSVCNWDLMVKYSDGDKAEWGNLNLCSISKVTLFWDKSKNTTHASVE